MAAFTDRFAKVLMPKSLTTREEKEIFAYGLAALFGGAVTFTAAILISIPFHSTLETLVFILSFLVLRKTTSGLHLKSSAACMICTQLFCAAAVNGLAPLLKRPPSFLLTLLLLAAGVYILLFAPVRHVNLGLSDTEAAALHTKAVVVFLVEFFTFMVLYYAIPQGQPAALNICTAVLLTVMLMVAAKIAHQEESV